MNESREPIFQRRPILMAALVSIATVVVMAALLEGVLRLLVRYQPGYYTAIEDRRGAAVYPFGTIVYNRFGFPDDEFLLDDPRPRVGYIGDSVTRGVGAGHGYRISEVLEEYHPELQHMNLSQGIGTGIDMAHIDAVLRQVEEFDLDLVVYLANMNDILPTRDDDEVGTRTTYRRVKDWLGYFDVLRGNSYLYTSARNALKDLLMRHGIGVEGVAYELHPERHAEVIEETAARIRLLDDALAERGVRFVTVIIPYEMQISEEAERIYRDLGIDWEEGFIDLATQRKLEAHLADLEVIDAAAAFLDHEEGKDAARRSNRLGQYFVYDRGGRLDWNHPTRDGHRRIAEFLAASGIFAESVASRR